LSGADKEEEGNSNHGCVAVVAVAIVNNSELLDRAHHREGLLLEYSCA
jgi:hypothetical protein